MEYAKQRMLFATNLKWVLKEKGMSQSELARKLHVSQLTVHLYTKGIVSPSFKILMNMIEILDTDANALLLGIAERGIK